jgi:D-glycero-alpha-D-manno-heptose-7-phosphate kinase
MMAGSLGSDGHGFVLRAKAPLRLSFAGGGTDVPPYPEIEGGSVLSATINRYAYGTLRPRTDDQIRIRSLDFGMTVTYSSDDIRVYDGKLDLVKAAIAHLEVPPGGFELFLHSDAPPGSGLGASSAMAVALVGLINEWKAAAIGAYQIADKAYWIERVEMGIEGGLQDHYSATFGGFNFIEFLPGAVTVNPLRIPDEVQNELQYNLLLAFTGQIRLSANIIEDQVHRYRSGAEESVDALRELKRLSVEMKRCLLEHRLSNFGPLLDEQWRHKKRMSPRISTPELDAIYAEAMAAGATGGKVTGAGGGGYMLFYCPNETRHAVARRLGEIGCTVADFSFEPRGLQTWRAWDSEVARIE